jgi:putative ABC transport system substrate-binding protein
MAAVYPGLPLSRRRFVQGASVAGLGLLAGCGRLPGQEPPPARIPRVGYLEDAGPAGEGLAIFREGLHDLGYVEGQNVLIEFRDPGRDPERLAEFAAELARLPVDVLVGESTTEVRAAMRATTTIPIVMVVSADPVGLGLVASLNRPGGNVTGPSFLSRELIPKRLELLKETLPGASRLSLLVGPGEDLVGNQVWAAAEALGVHLRMLRTSGPESLADAFATAVQDGVDGVLVAPNPMFGNADTQGRLAHAASLSRLPIMHTSRAPVMLGGVLMSYGADTAALRRRAAGYVDRILKGAKPTDLPVEQPREFDFVINLKTAQTLGLTIPQHVLLQATEIIQ